MNPPRLDRRIPELDGIRGLAILLVLLWHFIPCQGSERAGGILAIAGRMLSLTWSGVDLFFVLSGFLITGILIENRDAPNYFKAFYARRAFRILPLYLAILTLFVLLTPTLGSDERFAWLFANPHPLATYLTFTQNFPMGLQNSFGPNWLGVTWSLAVEEQFYLVAPAAIFLLPRRWLSIVAVLAIFGSVFMRHYLPGLLAFTMLPARADAFAAGVIAAIAMRNPTARSLLEQNKLFLLALFVGLLSGLMILTVQANYFGALRHTWIALTYAVFLLAAVLGCFGPLLRFSPLIWLGTVSYGVYLFHQPITGLLHGFFTGGPPQIITQQGQVLTITALLLTLAVSAVSFYVFEQPLVRFGRRFRYFPILPLPTVDTNDAAEPLPVGTLGSQVISTAERFR